MEKGNAYHKKIISSSSSVMLDNVSRQYTLFDTVFDFSSLIQGHSTQNGGGILLVAVRFIMDYCSISFY